MYISPQVIPGSEINIGDWVRFQRGGQLVIGVVNYFRDDYSFLGTIVVTDIGEVRFKSILETRKGL